MNKMARNTKSKENPNLNQQLTSRTSHVRITVHAIQHRTVVISFLLLRTITIAQMLSTGGWGTYSPHFEFSSYGVNEL